MISDKSGTSADGSAPFGWARLRSAGLGPVRLGSVPFGSVRFRSVPLGSARLASAQPRPARSGCKHCPAELRSRHCACAERTNAAAGGGRGGKRSLGRTTRAGAGAGAVRGVPGMERVGIGSVRSVENFQQLLPKATAPPKPCRARSVWRAGTTLWLSFFPSQSSWAHLPIPAWMPFPIPRLSALPKLLHLHTRSSSSLPSCPSCPSPGGAVTTLSQLLVAPGRPGDASAFGFYLFQILFCLSVHF